MNLHETRLRPLVLCMVTAVGAILAQGSAHPAIAQAANLQGTWSGSGRVVFPSGESERARCRATFRQQSARSFNMSAVCATSSARVAQTARVRRTSPSTFEGQFYNSEYEISGTIHITVRGSRLSASLSGGGGRGNFSLSR
jgi:hypothetical protein